MSARDRLPQLDGGLFITDGGLETTLIFKRGIELPLFAAFTLLADEDGRRALRDYYEPYMAVAAEYDAGFLLDTPTWRASPRWAAELGISPERARGAQPKLGRADRGAARRARRADRRADRAHRGDRAPGRRLPAAPAARGRRGAGVPRDPDLDLRRHRRRDGLRDDADLRRGGDRDHPRARRRPGSPPRSRSRSRPTAACRAARRWPRRSSRSSPRPPAGPRTTWSTAPTRPTSSGCWSRTRRGPSGSSACARTPRP